MPTTVLHRFKLVILPLIFLVITSIAFADKAPTQPAPAEFNADQANRLLYKLTINLSVQDLSAQNLQKAVDTLHTYQSLAQKCITDKNNELTDINKQLTAIGVTGKDSKDLTKDQKYLVNKQNQVSQQLAECRLFTIRSQEAISTFTSAIARLTTNELLSARPPIWENIKACSKLVLGIQTIDFSNIVDLDHGLYYFNSISLSLLGLSLVLGVIIGVTLRRSASRNIQRQQNSSAIAPLKLAFYCVIKRYAIWLSLGFVLTVFATFIALIWQDITDFTRISYGLLVLFLFLASASFFFYPPKPALAFSRLPPAVSRKLKFRLTLLAWWSFIGYVSYVLVNGESIPAELVYFCRSVFVILLAINLISVIWLTTQAIPWFNPHLAARRTFNILLSISLSITLVAEIFGYFNLSNYILSGTAFTLAYCFIGWVLFKTFNSMLQAPNNKGYMWQKKLYQHLSLPRKETLPEFLCLKIGLNTLFSALLLAALIKIWGVSNGYFHSAVQVLVSGFTVGSIHITPLRIVLGLIVFAFLSMTVRLLRQRLLKQRVAQAEDSHEALAVILGYVGFGLSFLFAVLIAGINLTGFAVIAGALSVGIGFGLQNIVNNFVSGIILLIERPIKPGDRIVVGQTEGYVKKISVRSTRITTPDRADVLVPNSELISGQVTNMMFQDNEFRVKIPIGVAYGSDTELVNRLLMDIATAHPCIVKEPDASPLVYFKQFADSSLNFELNCIIGDVNQRTRIISDLNFAIEKTFREHNIEIPFPQRDINIKSWPGPIFSELKQ